MNGVQFQLALAKLGMTQKDFAKRFGIGLRTVGHWTSSGVANPFAVIVIHHLLREVRDGKSSAHSH